MNAPQVTNIAARCPAGIASQTVAEKVAEYVSDFRYEDIPEATRERAKLLVLDAVGIALASTQYDFAHRMLTGLNALNEGGSSSLIGLPGKLALRDAVLMNGVLVHGLDYDDTHIRAIVHATASAFPCALGVAEAIDAPGSALLAAYVLGVEVATRVSDAAGGRFHDFGFHPTGLVAHFSCALQAGWLYGLTLAPARHGAGASRAARLRAVRSSWRKARGTSACTPAGPARQALRLRSLRVRASKGRRNRTKAASASSRAISARSRNLGSLRGDLRKPGQDVGAARRRRQAVPHLPSHTRLRRLRARPQGKALDRCPDEIERIVALVPQPSLHIIAEPPANKLRPANEYDAKFSTQFVVATCLVKGRFGLAELLDDTLARRRRSSHSRAKWNVSPIPTRRIRLTFQAAS